MVRQFGIGRRRIARQKKRNEELERHEKEHREKVEGSVELGFGVRRRLGEKELEKELGKLEVKVYSRHRQINIIGLYGPHIKPHLENIKEYKESFEILTPPIGYQMDLVSRDLATLDRYHRDPNRTGSNCYEESGV